MPIRLYMDEQVQNAITVGLLRTGIDVLRVQDDGYSNTDDEVILNRAASLGRIVFTRDVDFLAIAHARQLTGVPFSGVAYAHPLGLSIGECLLELELIAGASEPSDWANKVEYLPL